MLEGFNCFLAYMFRFARLQEVCACRHGACISMSSPSVEALIAGISYLLHQLAINRKCSDK